MKLRVTIQKQVEIETNEKIIEDLYEIHKESMWSSGTDNQYAEAEKIIEKIVGIPVYTYENDKKCIIAVYTEDEVPILEY